MARARGEAPRRPVAIWIAAGAVTAAVAAAFVLVRGGGDRGEWPVAEVGGSGAALGEGPLALGSAETDRAWRVGPDEVKVERGGQLLLEERTKKRTRLTLKQGRVLAHV